MEIKIIIIIEKWNPRSRLMNSITCLKLIILMIKNLLEIKVKLRLSSNCKKIKLKKIK